MSAPPAVTGPGTGVVSSSTTVPLIKTDRSKLTLIDEESMMKRIMATHDPKYDPEFNVKDLLNLVQNILSLAAETKDPGQPHTLLVEKSNEITHIPNLQALRNITDSISLKIRYKERGRGDEEETTMSLFKMLSSYSWEAKMVVAMAALALNYAESCLLAQAYSSNPFTKSMEFFQTLRKPFVLEFTETTKAQFDELMKVMMDMTSCVVEFKELPSIYISTTEVPAFTEAIASIPMAVYRIITSIVACASWINNLPNLAKKSITPAPWDFAKLQETCKLLMAKLYTCRIHIEEKRNDEAYIMLLNLYDISHIDNMNILRALLQSKNDVSPLIDGVTKKRVSLDVLRRRTVLLLISGVDMNNNEFAILEQIYNESRFHATRMGSLYEVVWIPMVNPKQPNIDDMHMRFETMLDIMPWYSVHHPTMVEGVAIRFIKDVWHFKNKPILVVVDPQGKVVCPNAFHMMWIWGSNAFPFTTYREESLWKEESWRLELLVDGIDPTILNWIRDDKYIFLYGGDDIDWIRQFNTTARRVAWKANIALEMVYVGKSTKTNKVRRVIEMIITENLSYAWLDTTIIWFFWTRLESMLFSKIQRGKIDEDDSMMDEIKKLLSYDKEGRWAVLSKGSNIVVNGHSTTIMPTLMEYDKWKEQVPVKGFDKAFKEHHDKLSSHSSHCCCQFDFPTDSGGIPEQFVCPHCSSIMEKYITFSCCEDDDMPVEYA